MAAPTVTDVQGQRQTIRSKTNKKKPSYKNVLLAPHPVTWPVIDESVEEEVLEKIKSLNLGRPEREKDKVRIFRKEERKKHREEERRKREEEKQIRLAKEGPTPEEQLGSQLVMGLNKVVRCLERGELRLAVIGRDVSQSLLSMTYQLIPLCHSRGCPVACIRGVQRQLAPLLNLSSLLAFGIKVKSTDGHKHLVCQMSNGSESSALDELVDFVSSRCEPLDVPWLQDGTAGSSFADKTPRMAEAPQKASGDCEEELSDTQKSKVERVSEDLDLNTDSGKIPQTVIKKSLSPKRKFEEKCEKSVEKNFPTDIALSEKSDYSDLYIWKNSADVTERGNASSKALDFIHIGLVNESDDEEEGELVSFILPKSSKTWEVNLGVIDLTCDTTDVSPSSTISQNVRVAKRKAGEIQNETVSKFKKANIKQKKSNPNRKKGKKKKGNKQGGS